MLRRIADSLWVNRENLSLSLSKKVMSKKVIVENSHLQLYLTCSVIVGGLVRFFVCLPFGLEPGRFVILQQIIQSTMITSERRCKVTDADYYLFGGFIMFPPFNCEECLSSNRGKWPFSIVMDRMVQNGLTYLDLFCHMENKEFKGNKIGTLREVF